MPPEEKLVLRASRQSPSTGTSPQPPRYQQLDHSARQIRILRLLPGSSTAPVACKLYTVSLDDQPLYEALSYAWGLPHVTHSIILNGEKSEVTVNLHYALRRLRRPFRSRHLWVDALCINQTDEKEKSHQVNLMKEIYSKTCSAILWLGDFLDDQSPNPGSQLAPHASSVPNKVLRDTALVAFSLLNSMAKNEHYWIRDNPDAAERRIADLDSILHLSWWQRIWTVQEAVLPEKAILQCGTLTIPWQKLCLACKNSESHFAAGCCEEGEEDSFLANLWNTAQGIEYLRNARPSVERVSVAANLFRARQGSDPRDRMYALLGMGSTLSADYSISSHESVFKMAVRSFIAESGTTSSLLRPSEVDRSPTLPTWVPDFCAGMDPRWLGDEVGWLLADKLFNSSRSTKSTPSNSTSDHILRLEGFVVDQIVTFGDPLENMADAPEIIAQWQGIVSAHCAAHSDRYPLVGTYHDAFWTTVMAGMVYDDAEVDLYRRLVPADEANVRQCWSPDSFLSLWLWGRTRLFLTRTGLVGLGKIGMEVGDSVCVLKGGNMPFLLRTAETSDDDGAHRYKYIGHAYLHGIMDGELVDNSREWERISFV